MKLFADVDDGKIKLTREQDEDFEFETTDIIVMKVSDLVGMTNVYEIFERESLTVPTLAEIDDWYFGKRALSINTAPLPDAKGMAVYLTERHATSSHVDDTMMRLPPDEIYINDTDVESVFRSGTKDVLLTYKDRPMQTFSLSLGFAIDLLKKTLPSVPPEIFRALEVELEKKARTS